MLGLIIWRLSIFLEALLLSRALFAKVFSRYPYFYAYVSCVFFVDLTRHFVYTRHASAFRDWYWSTQFLSVAVGYGVMIEILRQVLMRYKGAAQFGNRLLWLSFFSVVAYVVYKSLSSTNWSAGQTGAMLERDLRTVQAFVIVGILAIVSYYGIELGRNLKGMIFGYGAFIGISIVELAAQAHGGARIDAALRAAESYSFFVPLAAWIATLWSYRPAPNAPVSTQLELDYESLAQRTKAMIGAIRDTFRGT